MGNPLLHPFRLTPHLAEKPWGGSRLESSDTARANASPIGEAHFTAAAATIADGPLAGRLLAEIVTTHSIDVIGDLALSRIGQRHLFPILVKLIDAQRDLSIQVHPTNDNAPTGALGKTEMYHVLAAAAGSRIALGLRSDVQWDDFARASRAGTGTARLLRWLPARPGTTYQIPAGTVHALGAGCFIYEAQQPSDITFRLDDWGRRDTSGKPRPLQIEEGLAVVNAESRPRPVPPISLAPSVGRRHLLSTCEFFAVERVALAAGEELSVSARGSAQVIVCLRGNLEMRTGAGVTTLMALQAGAISAAAATGWLRAINPTVLLRAWVPGPTQGVSAVTHGMGSA